MGKKNKKNHVVGKPAVTSSKPEKMEAFDPSTMPGETKQGTSYISYTPPAEPSEQEKIELARAEASAKQQQKPPVEAKKPEPSKQSETAKTVVATSKPAIQNPPKQAEDKKPVPVHTKPNPVKGAAKALTAGAKKLQEQWANSLIIGAIKERPDEKPFQLTEQETQILKASADHLRRYLKGASEYLSDEAWNHFVNKCIVIPTHVQNQLVRMDNYLDKYGYKPESKKKTA